VGPGARRGALTTAREFGRAPPVRQEAEVADPNKAAQEDVEEKAIPRPVAGAPEELRRRQRHPLDAVPVAIIFPPQANLAVVPTDQPVV